MNPKDIERFFKTLSKHVNFTLRVILTGGAAALAQGSARVTRDIDFQVAFASRSLKRRERLEQAIQRTSQETGIAAEYSEDIDRWSSIALPKTRRSPAFFHHYGKIRVHIMDPLLWAVGKLARFLPSDIQDLVTVLKRSKVSARVAARVWGKALGQSPASSAQPLFKRQVIYFFQRYARTIWGPKADPEKLGALFLATARRQRLPIR